MTVDPNTPVYRMVEPTSPVTNDIADQINSAAAALLMEAAVERFGRSNGGGWWSD